MSHNADLDVIKDTFASNESEMEKVDADLGGSCSNLWPNLWKT